MEAACSPETSADFQYTTWCYIPENLHPSGFSKMKLTLVFIDFFIIFTLINYEGLATCAEKIKPVVPHKIRQETVPKLCKVLAIPSLLYDSEFWTLSKKKRNKFKLLKLRFLRPLAGYRIIYQKWMNVRIRHELNIVVFDVCEGNEYQQNYSKYIWRKSTD